MSGEQYLAFYKETTRGVAPGSPSFMYLQISKGFPKFKATDEARNEFAGASNALGARTNWRKQAQYSCAPEILYRPGLETGVFLKHVLGYAGTRATVDSTAFRGILYPTCAMPYGSGMPLGDEALGLVSNLDESGTTKSQAFGGFRPKSLSLAFKGTDEVTLSIDGQGAGDWVGPCDQAETGGISMPTIDPFNCSEIAYYLGSGIVRTGTAPDFTDIQPGTMQRLNPDTVTLKITNGLDDKIIGNGVKGPSKTFRNAQFGVEVSIDTDYTDPSSGFSSAAEYKRTLSGVAHNSLLIVMTHPDLAGSATEHYQTVIDIPLLWLQADPREPDNEGKTPIQKLTYKSLLDPSVGYPIGFLTTDRAAAY